MPENEETTAQEAVDRAAAAAATLQAEAVSASPLQLLRKPFPADQVGKLPKPTKSQTEEVRRDFKRGARCTECGGWHHPKVVHLDYVGHAALTNRLLDADLQWNWEPAAWTPEGTPHFDRNGGLWVRLTVCGTSRLGYGNAPDKGTDPGNREKECIGDALRNASMRFGAALDLWHKGEGQLYTEEGHGEEEGPPARDKRTPPQPKAGADSEPEATKSTKPITGAQKDVLRNLCKELSLSPEKRAEVCLKVTGETIQKLTVGGAEKLTTHLQVQAMKAEGGK